jgi:hypothetical protein
MDISTAIQHCRRGGLRLKQARDKSRHVDADVEQSQITFRAGGMIPFLFFHKPGQRCRIIALSAVSFDRKESGSLCSMTKVKLFADMT